MTGSSRLVMSQGPQPGQTFMLDKDVMTLGRAPSNDIVINDPQVSRQHARIIREGVLMVLEDTGSTNGTFANGVRLTTRHTLANGDVISLGDAVTLTYYGVSIATTERLAGQTVPSAPPSFEPQPARPPAHAPAPPSAFAEVPPADYGPPSLEVGPAVEEPVGERKSKTWLWVGCAGLVMLVVVACVGVVVLDYLKLLPPIFYQPLFWLGLDKYFVR